MPMPRERPLDAEGLARSGAVIERSYPVSGFARLRDRLSDAEGSATVRAEFHALRGAPAATLRVRADVVLVCQRCLGPVARRLESETEIVFAPEDTVDLPEEAEAVDGDPRHVDLGSLVEDELLLSLPVVSRHAEGERCALPGVADKKGPAEPADMRRPFAGLADLLKS